MNLNAILTDLRAQRNRLDEAIAVMERLAAGEGKRRGRPPSWLKGAALSLEDPPLEAPRKRGRPSKTKAQSVAGVVQ